MAKRNDFLTKMQRRHEFEAKTSVILAEKWTRQAACDALVLLLGYGDAMGGKPWGREKILKAVNEWTEVFLWVSKGAQGDPDSDAIRVKVDRMLKPKVPEELYRDWEGRYPGWQEETFEQETDRMRPGWKREGKIAEDSTTSNLLKGVEQDAEKARGKMV